ncbi:MAG: thioredoxin family protein [Eubacteriaceae bacterium]|nr:thioredoxin family protein [Eubacteriaceae bacterium]
MVIKVLGSGCKNCIMLEKNTVEAVNEMKIDAVVEKVNDLNKIMEYGIMTTPAIVIDEKVVSYGKVLKPKDIIKLIEKEIK